MEKSYTELNLGNNFRVQPDALRTYVNLNFCYLISLLLIWLIFIAAGYVFLVFLPEPKYFILGKSYFSRLVDRYLKYPISIGNRKRWICLQGEVSLLDFSYEDLHMFIFIIIHEGPSKELEN